MVLERLHHSTQDIYEKEFKTDTRGYRNKEVDQFLDEIIEDEELMLDYIEKLEVEKEELISEVMSLKQKLRNMKMNIDIAQSDVSEVTNMDILRRISNLEKMVYGKDE